MEAKIKVEDETDIGASVCLSDRIAEIMINQKNNMTILSPINQQPEPYSPAYNENIYLVSSSGTAQANFRYIFDVYQSNGTTLIARVKLPARPGDNRGLFDAKRIIENYLSYDLPAANETAGFKINSSSFYKYTVKVGEEWGNESEWPDQQVISGKYIWNAALDWLEFRNFDHEDYLMTIGESGGRFLTNAPSTQMIELNQNAWLSMMTASSGSIRTAQIKRYNAAGNQLVGTLNITNVNDPIDADTDRFLRLATGPANISAHTPGWLNGVVYYTVQILDSGGSAVSDLVQYNITSSCKYEAVRLHWLNKLGGWDSFNFTMKSSESLAVTRQQYKQRYGSTTGTSWSYASHERGDVIFDSRAKQTFRVNSDWINEEESAWLEELLTSPEVYVELDATTLVAVVIKTSKYEKRKKQNDRLFNLALEYEYSFEKIRQRG